MKQLTTKGTAKPHGIPHLRTLRQRKGLSLGQLADMTGIRRDTIAHLENGREDPQPYHLRLLARALEVPAFDLSHSNTLFESASVLVPSKIAPDR